MSQWTQVGYSIHNWSHSLEYVDKLTSLQFKCADNGYIDRQEIDVNVDDVTARKRNEKGGSIA